MERIFPSNVQFVLDHVAVFMIRADGSVARQQCDCAIPHRPVHPANINATGGIDGPVIYSRAMRAKISFATARLDDAAAMAEFLSGIPNGEVLGKVLQKREAVSSRAYDDETWTARFVDSDGRVVRCFAVTDVTIDQAEMIAAACIDIPAVDEAGFREVVAQSLGPTIDAIE
jgi:hypothetical protein